MATSSFTKNFVLPESAKKIMEETPAKKIPNTARDKLKEGKEALARFSPRLKKS